MGGGTGPRRPGIGNWRKAAADAQEFGRRIGCPSAPRLRWGRATAEAQEVGRQGQTLASRRLGVGATAGAQAVCRAVTALWATC
jgi:hypothetical protein